MINYYDSKIDLTLLGCGFLGTYHLGAICLLSQIWPHKPYNRIAGSSCGGLLGTLMVAGLGMERVFTTAIGILRRLGELVRRPSLRRLVSMMQLVEQSLERMLPPDAHLTCSGRLGISVTSLWPAKNEFVSQFRSRRELIQATCAGCFIPLWSGSWRVPVFRGKRCVDGAYTNNRPRFPVAQSTSTLQVEVCPFSSPEIRVSPRRAANCLTLGSFRLLDTSYYLEWANFIRMTHAMIPMRLPTYKVYLLGGHADMKDFVLANELVKCRQCHSQAAGAGPAKRRSCIGCLRLLERVDSLRVPPEFHRLLRD